MLGASGSLAPMNGRRILAVRAGALGDTLLALPAIAALRGIVGDAGRVEVLGTGPALRLALGPRHASQVHSIDRAAFRAFFHEGADDEELLAFLEGFDLVVAWSNLPLLAAKAGSIGVEVMETPPFPPEGTHASEHLYRSLSSLGVGPPTPSPQIDLDPDFRRAAEAFLASHGLSPGGFVALHPSSGSARKNWYADGFCGLAERARDQGLEVLWIEGEADSGVVQSVERAFPAPVARGLRLEVLAAVLAEARAYFGNDSGVTHLAAAVGVPTIALFGPTDPRCWAPRGRAVRVVEFRCSARGVWGIAHEIMRSR